MGTRRKRERKQAHRYPKSFGLTQENTSKHAVHIRDVLYDALVCRRLIANVKLKYCDHYDA